MCIITRHSTFSYTQLVMEWVSDPWQHLDAVQAGQPLHSDHQPKI